MGLVLLEPLKSGSTILKQEVFAYDSATKRLETMTLKIPGQADQEYSYHYKADTEIVDGVSGGGVSTDLTFEANNPRVHNVTVTGPDDDVLYDATFGYNQVDQRSTESVSYTKAGGGTVAYSGSFGYDTENPEIDQPTGALASASRTYTSGGLSNESYAYEYDHVGNRTYASTGAVTAISSPEFNNLNQNTAFAYDERGNQVIGYTAAGGYWSYHWDAADRMVSADAALIHVEYGYDPSGRRTEKRVFTIADDETGAETLDQGRSRRFAWNGQKIEAEFDLGNHLLITYAWSPAGGLLAVTDHRGTIPITYRVIQDATGSVVGLIAPDGSIAATYRYDPYGRQLEASGPAADVCGYRFAGGYWDEESRLQDHCRRYYSPEDGRWLSRDPIAEQGGVNVYAYCGGDPVNLSDTDGLDGVFVANTGPAKEIVWGGYYHSQYKFSKTTELLDGGGKYVSYEVYLHVDQGFSAGPGAMPFRKSDDYTIAKQRFLIQNDTESSTDEGLLELGIQSRIDRLQIYLNEDTNEENRKELTDLLPIAGTARKIAAGEDAKFSLMMDVATFLGPALMARTGRMAVGLSAGAKAAGGIIVRGGEGMVISRGAGLATAGEIEFTPKVFSVSVPRTTLAAAEEGAAGSLLPASSLSRRHAAIVSSLPEQGATGWFSKSGVSMADLRAVGRVTGDEFSMYTVGGRRFIIRGFGNEIRVAPDVADAVAAGRYGRWSGHTHPPGYGMDASVVDRARIPAGQARSALWADDGFRIFYRTPAEDAIFEAARRSEMMRRFYGQ